MWVFNQAGPRGEMRGRGFDGPGGPRGGFGARRYGGRERWRGGFRGPGMGMAGEMFPGMMLDRGLIASFRQLNLTPVQREQVRTILFNAQESVRMQMATAQQSGAAQQARENLAALQNPGDPNYAKALQQYKARAAERLQQSIQLGSDTQQKLYNVLTAEQKAQLPKVLADLEAQRAQRAARANGPQRRGEGQRPSPPPPQ